MSRAVLFFFAALISINCGIFFQEDILPGASRSDIYLPLLKDKRAGLVVNHSSLAGRVHLVDYLISRDVDIVRIFAPEHGFRGNVSAGEKIADGVDIKSGIPLISLYGDNHKPLPRQLADIDVVVFDIQDVGCRFYTYISTLHYVIEACAENGIPLLVFDRPNPNGDYVAGPLLETGFRSFVGMHPIPVVYGCTIGELALMINGEHWHKAPEKCDLTVIPVKNYNHKTRYSLPVIPSPNLPNDLSVRLYPSLCFFEATSVSVGRGTDYPFQVIGGTNPGLGDFRFIPRSIPGVALSPVNQGKVCYGRDLRMIENVPEFTLKFFIDFYDKFENEEDFITREGWFNLLAGNDSLIKKIRKGWSQEEIENSWKAGLIGYKEIRKRYLLYTDFE